MSFLQLLRTQWADYPHVHANGTNLLVHLLTAPVFMAGTVAFFWGFCALSITLSAVGLIAMVAAIMAQGWGHTHEARPPAPFTGRANAFARIFLEQWVTFPRYIAYRLGRALRH
ncbi:MAG TPA: terminase [Burkholderiaceae bacterium]|nr:terminase [Burkholderiaceae bacterium]